jgi:hypothetical protein
MEPDKTQLLQALSANPADSPAAQAQKRAMLNQQTQIMQLPQGLQQPFANQPTGVTPKEIADKIAFAQAQQAMMQRLGSPPYAPQ